MKCTLFPKLCNSLAAALLLGMMVGQLGIAQTTSGATRSYTQTVSTYFEINQGDHARLFDFEKVSMKNTTEVRNVSTVVDPNNDVTTVINIISSNLSEPWMTPPSKIVIDKWGVKLYNAQNTVISQEAYTPEQLQDYNSIKSSLAQNGWQSLSPLQPLTPQHISQLQQQGFAVQNLPGGIVKASKGNTSLTYDSNGMSYGISLLEGSKVVSETNFKFQQVEGITVPQSKIERAYKTTPSGVCYAQVTHTVFSNYQSSSLP